MNLLFWSRPIPFFLIYFLHPRISCDLKWSLPLSLSAAPVLFFFSSFYFALSLWMSHYFKFTLCSRHDRCLSPYKWICCILNEESEGERDRGRVKKEEMRIVTLKMRVLAVHKQHENARKKKPFAQTHTHKLITEIFHQKPFATPVRMRTIIIFILSFLVSVAAEFLRVIIIRSFFFSSFLISFIFYTL